jgi:hypothetical protein
LTTLIVLATVASYAVGWVVRLPALVPILNTLASYPFMVLALRRGDLRLAVTRMLVWALSLGVCATVISYDRPWESGALFLRGASYRTEMFVWVMTGRGAESTPAQFIPDELAQAALFTSCALLTGGALAMAMGAVLMNDMGHYVGSLAAASARPGLTLILAWHPWAVIRIVAFVTLGVVLSVPLLSRVGGVRIDGSLARRLVRWAGAGLVADVALKAALAPAWHRLLLRVVGW